MKKEIYASNLKRYKTLAKRINAHLAGQSRATETVFAEWVKQCKELYQKLLCVVSPRTLRRTLSAMSLAFIFGTSSIQGQSFSAPQISLFSSIPANFDFTVHDFGDIDNDGDFDIIAVGHDTSFSNFLYIENTGRPDSAAFATGVVNPFGLAEIDSFYYSPALADLDNDGDLDILLSSLYSPNARFLYYENTGSATAPAFSSPITDPFGLSLPTNSYYHFSSVADLDNDGDFDVLTGSYAYSTYEVNFLYFENEGSPDAPSFGSPSANPFGLSEADTSGYFVIPALGDIDNDGDLDLLSGFYSYDIRGAFDYYENTGSAGSPMFASPNRNPGNLDAQNVDLIPKLVDIDNDGDLDVMAINYFNADSLFFYENLDIVSSIKNPHQLRGLQLEPNPTKDWVSLSVDRNGYQGNIEVTLLNIAGQRVKSLTIPHDSNARFSIQELKSGLYYAKVTLGDKWAVLPVLKED